MDFQVKFDSIIQAVHKDSYAIIYFYVYVLQIIFYLH